MLPEKFNELLYDVRKVSSGLEYFLLIFARETVLDAEFDSASSDDIFEGGGLACGCGCGRGVRVRIRVTLTFSLTVIFSSTPTATS